MAYENLNLPDNAIPEGSDISHIEEGVAELYNSLADSAGSYTGSSIDDLLTAVNSLSANKGATLYTSNSDAVSILSNGDTTSSAKIVAIKMGTNNFDYIMWVGNGSSLYTGRYETGTVTVRKYTGTTITLSATADDSIE